MIGTQAQVPIHNGRSFAYTSVGCRGRRPEPRSGTAGVNQATYTVPQHWFQIGLETSVWTQAASQRCRGREGKGSRDRGALENMKHQLVPSASDER